MTQGHEYRLSLSSSITKRKYNFSKMGDSEQKLWETILRVLWSVGWINESKWRPCLRIVIYYKLNLSTRG